MVQRMAKKEKDELAEVAKEAADATRKRGKAMLKANLDATKAELLATKAEFVFLQSQAVATSYKAELERRQKALEGSITDDDKGTSGELDRLTKRYEAAQRKADNHRATYEEHAANAKEAAFTRNKFL